MKLTFIGADHEVTGSCHFLEAAGKNILIDYGMEQGKNTYENMPLPVKASKIDYVFLTHAHIDHSGNLPLLAMEGFSGQIFATPATCDLCDIMLRDSAGIQEFEAEWRNRKGKRKGDAPFVPYYTMADAERILRQFEEIPYGVIAEICPGIELRFTDVGHLLGSATIEVWVVEDGVRRKIVFSGDIGNAGQPLVRDPQLIGDADYVVMESTYGDRSHGPQEDYISKLVEVVQRTFDRGGNVVIPSFAVGRTQEMLYFFRQIKERGLIKNHDDFEVYMDSPLALKATDIFNDHTYDCFNDEALELLNAGINPIGFPGLRHATTPDESKEINFISKPKVIISASGMCEAGRIKHHLKHNLWRADSTILFVGYQAEGTLGRRLLEGAEEVKLFNEPVTVAAEICQLPGISAHADREGLLEWAAGFREKPLKCFVVHGEDAVTASFAELLRERLGWDAMAPYSGTIYDLAADCTVKETVGIPFVKRDAEGNPIIAKERASAPYLRLEKTAERLMAVIRMNRGLSNKDLAKFADQLNALCDKWER
ncbi:MAG: MBL fold metallo-hydrolase [Lachnospiraceae bacterium]|nr:MBL fold metallo-hydrolase [Lachnospiraceae bacterium]